MIVLVAAFVLAGSLAACQSAEQGEKVMNSLSAFYNKQDYHSLYLMLSPEFKAQITEEKITSFYKNNVVQPYGNMRSWDLVSKAGMLKYLVHMERGDLDLDLALNKNDEIAGMQWLPAKKKKAIAKLPASSIKSNNPKQTAVQQLLDSLAIAHLQDPANCGLSIAIIDGDKTDTYFYGATDKKTGRLPDAASLYEIGSVSKTFTAIVLAHAINEGRVKPDDDIRKYLPGAYPNLEYKGMPITLKNLSNHTAGFPRMPPNFAEQKDYDERNPFKYYTREMFLEYLHSFKPEVQPGTVSDYSNYGVALLGMILENVYKKTIAELVTTYVTDPAGMKHTTFDVPQHAQQLLTTGYNEEGAEWSYWTIGVFNPAGGLKSDIMDMAVYVRANMKEVNNDFALSHQLTFTDERYSIGLNWIISPTKNKQTMIWHNGETGGFHSFAGYIKEAGVGIVILSNSQQNIDNMATAMLTKVAARQ